MRALQASRVRKEYNVCFKKKEIHFYNRKKALEHTKEMIIE